MINDAAILKAEFDKLKDELIQKHVTLGMPASENWIRETENRSQRLSGQLWGAHYTEQLVNGRRPGKFPPVKMIEQWIYDKGITPDGIKISSLAFLIARKIAREGTNYFKQGGTDLVDAVITPRRIQEIIDKVTEFHINNFVSEVTGVFKKMAA
ncbi:hypothetical protein SAMN06296241_1369 [Salinimicrobium sediminis]|uniref:Uncharacterized protein n=1 Tax=Salinimicrobium sediminis TaxID=1343891 RepID=A0A285X3E4_9FLAO|nr:hypothetical protein [Salinimicrobium sediminis]SOC79832.1 hypothetical protein SAMN06296241_1369 [Salinimicrobium sediminis]